MQWARHDQTGQTEAVPYHEPLLCPLGDQAQGGGLGIPPPPLCSDKTTQKTEDPRGFPTQAGAPCSDLGSRCSDSVTFQAGKMQET